MYLKYYINFKNLYNDDCRIEIYSKDNSTPIELIGGKETFTIDYDTDNFIYSPIKLSGATLRIVGGDYLQNLYSNNYYDHKVNFIKNGIIKWTGYLTPEIYSQDYNSETFEIELECISGLASLEYVDYDNKASKTNLFDLIKESLSKIDSDYRNIYYPNYYNKQLEELEISCKNFYDEDDKGMSYREILENICLFLNWTITEYNGEIWFLDYDYIASGGNKYYKLNKSMTVKSEATISGNITVQQCGFTGADNTLSIQGGYNKAVVIASDYEIKSDEIFKEIEYKDVNKQLMVTSNSLLDGNNKPTGDASYKIYYNQNEWELFQYNWINNNWIKGETNNNENKRAGAYACRMGYKAADNTTIEWDNIVEIRLGDTIPQRVTQEQHNILVLEGGMTKISNTQDELLDNDARFGELPFLKYTSSTPINFSNGYALLCKFNLRYNDKEREYVYSKRINNGDQAGTDHSKISKDAFYIPALLKFIDDNGNGFYWDDINKVWSVITSSITENQMKFKIYTNLNNKDQHFTFDWLGAKDTASIYGGYSDKNGSLFPFNTSGFGKFDLTLYIPQQKQNIYYHSFIYLKDLKFEVVKSESMFNISNNESEDTKYESITNDKFINEAEDIIFKITSSNDSFLSASKVFSNNQIIDTLIDWRSIKVKPETRLVERIINQYNQPKILLCQNIRDKINPYNIINDDYLSNKNFIWIGGEYNAFYDSLSLNMIEI